MKIGYPFDDQILPAFLAFTAGRADAGHYQVFKVLGTIDSIQAPWRDEADKNIGRSSIKTFSPKYRYGIREGGAVRTAGALGFDYGQGPGDGRTYGDHLIRAARLACPRFTRKGRLIKKKRDSQPG
jgi:hypothetical protein